MTAPLPTPQQSLGDVDELPTVVFGSRSLMWWGTVGFAVIAMGKLGSRELNYSSDVDLMLLFDAATLPRRGRDDAGEAADQCNRRTASPRARPATR